jgi:hypothetical protein
MVRPSPWPLVSLLPDSCERRDSRAGSVKVVCACTSSGNSGEHNCRETPQHAWRHGESTAPPRMCPACARTTRAVLCAAGRATGAGEPACRPGSVLPLARGGGHPSGTAVADSLVRSTREHRAGRPRSLTQETSGSPLDLAPGGVYQAAAVTCGAGGLLHRRFTLTPRTRRGAVCFLWHCPAGHPGSALPTTLPCGARTFLTGLAPGATARPTHPRSGYAERHRARVANRDGARE